MFQNPNIRNILTCQNLFSDEKGQNKQNQFEIHVSKIQTESKIWSKSKKKIILQVKRKQRQSVKERERNRHIYHHYD